MVFNFLFTKLFFFTFFYNEDILIWFKGEYVSWLEDKEMCSLIYTEWEAGQHSCVGVVGKARRAREEYLWDPSPLGCHRVALLSHCMIM